MKNEIVSFSISYFWLLLSKKQKTTIYSIGNDLNQKSNIQNINELSCLYERY